MPFDISPVSSLIDQFDYIISPHLEEESNGNNNSHNTNDDDDFFFLKQMDELFA